MAVRIVRLGAPRHLIRKYRAEWHAPKRGAKLV